MEKVIGDNSATSLEVKVSQRHEPDAHSFVVQYTMEGTVVDTAVATVSRLGTDELFGRPTIDIKAMPNVSVEFARLRMQLIQLVLEKAAVLQARYTGKEK